MDDRIWVSTQLSGGAAGFTQVTQSQFTGTPSAVGLQDQTSSGHIYVAAIQTGGNAFSNRAVSPP